MSYPPSIKYLTDVHCHPTDMEITDQVLNMIQLRARVLASDSDDPSSPQAMENLSLRVVTMATRVQDQHLVADLASRWPEKVGALEIRS